MQSTLTAAKIPCCICGTMILPNAANQCSYCLAHNFNLQGKLQQGPGGSDHVTIHQCRNCRRFKPASSRNYIYAEPESPELLAICLKHIPALQNTANNLHIVEASFIWTEPHSMRFRLSLTVRTEIQNVTIQQRVMVQQHCSFLMCDSCNREFTNRTWHALVQIRQKRDGPKKGLVVLEMALAKNGDIRKHVLKIDSTRNGLDFYFLDYNRAQMFVNFLNTVAPMRTKTTRKLVSTDVKNNTANMKHTITCDLVPLCRDDLVLITKQAKAKLAGKLTIVTKVASGMMQFMDASPKRDTILDAQMEIAAETYYKSEKNHRILLSANHLTRFVVLDVELCDAGHHDDNGDLYKGPQSGVAKYALADVVLAREADFGTNDETISVVTHLGNLLNAGDTALGYDLINTVGGDWELEKSFRSSVVLPDVVLVKKVAGNPASNDDNNTNSPTDVIEAQPKLSKKKQRKAKRNFKKAKELEESAVRMGFFEDHEELDDDMAAEVSALENEFEAMDLPSCQQDAAAQDAEKACT